MRLVCSLLLFVMEDGLDDDDDDDKIEVDVVVVVAVAVEK